MVYRFAEIAFTPAVKTAQEEHGSRAAYAEAEKQSDRDFRLGPAEAAFLAARDHFFMATVSATGWPYVQHRGGPPGFIQVLDKDHFAFPDFRGNRQYISLGNLAGNQRAAFIFMDFPNKSRLKALGQITSVTMAEDKALMQRLALQGYKAVPERAYLVKVEGLDWNCPQHITPRFSEAELAEALAPIRQRLADLEAENAALRAALAEHKGHQP
jgi:predicted pyridoxine 5'-phosphate oxidase superfamily flavin-nucleotide-binding protein